MKEKIKKDINYILSIIVFSVGYLTILGFLGYCIVVKCPTEVMISITTLFGIYSLSAMGTLGIVRIKTRR